MFSSNAGDVVTSDELNCGDTSPVAGRLLRSTQLHWESEAAPVHARLVRDSRWQIECRSHVNY